MRVVIDTDVVLSALRGPTGASRLVLSAVWEGAITVVVNVAIVVEYEAVLKRP
jgi:predicted nucleic acid-binding protein